jgi:excisionase family DNA binding protein
MSKTRPREAARAETHQIRPTLVTAAQAAERLGMSERWVRGAAWDGRLPSVKVGAALRFDPLALDEFVAANSRGAA